MSFVYPARQRAASDLKQRYVLGFLLARESHEMTRKEEDPNVSSDSLWFYFRVFRVFLG
jgi:hypothetical protein